MDGSTRSTPSVVGVNDTEASIEPTRDTTDGMSQVMISCPLTADLVPTGIEATSLEKLDQREYLLIDCPECGQDHVWIPSEAILVGPSVGLTSA